MNSLRWTLAVAANECGVSKSTIKRRLAAGDLPNATKGARGAWTVPVTDLIAAGLEPGRPSPPDDLTQVTDLDHEQPDLDHDPGHDLGQPGPNSDMTRVHELERDLAQERERARALTQANADLRSHIDDMRMAMRMIEPGPSRKAEDHSPESGAPAPEPHPSVDTAPTQTTQPPPPRQRWWQRPFRS